MATGTACEGGDRWTNDVATWSNSINDDVANVRGGLVASFIGGGQEQLPPSVMSSGVVHSKVPVLQSTGDHDRLITTRTCPA